MHYDVNFYSNYREINILAFYFTTPFSVWSDYRHFWRTPIFLFSVEVEADIFHKQSVTTQTARFHNTKHHSIQERLISNILYSWFCASSLNIDKTQQDATDAGIYLLQNYSTCFGCLSHSSSGLYQTVTAASGTGRCPGTMTCTRSCNYSLMYYWWWVWQTPETCRAILQ